MIGPDIAEVFDELGTEMTIHKQDGSTITEYMDIEFSMQASSPFLTQFLVNCTLVYNTQAEPGDIFSDAEGTRYILAADNLSKFENAVVVHECILYRCNVIGTLKERTNIRQGISYTPGWNPIETDIYALLTGLPNDKTLSDKKYGEFPSIEMNLHLSGFVPIKEKHRFELSNGDKLEVTGVEPRRLNNVTICVVRPDGRE